MAQQYDSGKPTVRGKFGVRVPAPHLVPRDNVADREQAEQAVKTQKRQDAMAFQERVKQQDPSERDVPMEQNRPKGSIFKRFTDKIRKPNELDSQLRDAIYVRRDAEKSVRDANALRQRAEDDFVRVSVKLKETEATLNAKNQINRQLSEALAQERAKLRALQNPSQEKELSREYTLDVMKEQRNEQRLKTLHDKAPSLFSNARKDDSHKDVSQEEYT